MSNQIEVRRPIPAAPIHPLAALATIVLDNLFTIPEIAAPELWILTIPLVGVTGFVSTLFIQHYLAKDSWGESVAKGLVMGIIAGVPFSVTGTATGGVLLAWAGLHEWLKFPMMQDQSQQLSSADDEIVEEVKEIKEEK